MTEYNLVVKDEGYEEPEQATTLKAKGWELLKSKGLTSTPAVGFSKVVEELWFDEEQLAVALIQDILGKMKVVTVRPSYNNVHGRFYPTYVGLMCWPKSDEEALEIMSEYENTKGCVVPSDSVRYKVQKSGLKIY